MDVAMNPGIVLYENISALIANLDRDDLGSVIST